MSAVRLYGRARPGFDTRVDATLAQLRAAAEAHPGRIVLATSLGAEDMVLTDLIVRHQVPISFATLDTGALPPQTLELLQRTRARYGITIDVFRPPAEAVVAFVDRHGRDAMKRSVELRKACCALRKLEPLARLLEGRTAWVTGLRREQSAARAELQPEERDAQGRFKFNPLIEWSQGDIWHYIGRHGVPYNDLHDQFHPSIGCAPCTRAVAVGEDERSGRWWWETQGDQECGLHVRNTPQIPRPVTA